MMDHVNEPPEPAGFRWQFLHNVPINRRRLVSAGNDVELLRKIRRVRPHPQAPPCIHLIASQSKQYFANSYWRGRCVRQEKFTDAREKGFEDAKHGRICPLVS